MTSCVAEPSGEPGAGMRREHGAWMRIYCHGMQIILLDLWRQWLVRSGGWLQNAKTSRVLQRAGILSARNIHSVARNGGREFAIAQIIIDAAPADGVAGEAGWPRGGKELGHPAGGEGGCRWHLRHV